MYGVNHKSKKFLEREFNRLAKKSIKIGDGGKFKIIWDGGRIKSVQVVPGRRRAPATKTPPTAVPPAEQQGKAIVSTVEGEPPKA